MLTVRTRCFVLEQMGNSWML